MVSLGCGLESAVAVTSAWTHSLWPSSPVSASARLANAPRRLEPLVIHDRAWEPGRRPALASPGLTIAVAGGAFAGAWTACQRSRRGAKNGLHAARAPVVARCAQGVRELTERQRQFWEILEEAFEEQVVPEFGKENLGRVYEFIQHCKYEKPIPTLPEHQESDPEYFPGLRAKPWWEPHELGDWVEKVRERLPYVQEELANFLEFNEEALVSDSVCNDTMGSGWSAYRLQRLGNWIGKNCANFPLTVQMLKEIRVPLAMRGVMVARQEPGTRVLPHSDGQNFMLTVHFGLLVPEEGCDITVAGETKQWKEDDAVVLDTSFSHQTRNESDEERFVFLFDVWHPDLTTPEWEALEFIYDMRNQFESGKIKYEERLPSGFWETLNKYSAWGGAYTEEKYESAVQTDDYKW